MSRFSDPAIPPRAAILVPSLAARDLVTKSAYKARGASYHTAYAWKLRMLDISVYGQRKEKENIFRKAPLKVYSNLN